MIRKATGILVLLVLFGCGGENAIDLETYDDALGTISGPGVRAHMDVLAADEMEAEWDVSGWKARSYKDKGDSEHWSGDNVYDVRSSSSDLALGGLTRYEEW